MIKTLDAFLQEGCGRCPLTATPNCKVHQWTEEIKLLRKIVLSCGLTEEIKWGFPCYSFQNKNVLMLVVFKEYCALSFLKGSLMKDEAKVLVKQGENTQNVRLAKFTDTNQINESRLKAYILEAIEIEKAGVKPIKEVKDEAKPQELITVLENDAALKKAFNALSPGKQRGYILYFSQAKQTKTRLERIENCTPKILKGEGLHDKYQSSGKK